MKKASVIILLALGVFACSRKTVSTSETVATPTTSTSSTTVSPTAVSTITEVPKADAEHAALVAEGKTVFTNRCGRCHGLKDVTAYTTTRWEGILKVMGPKARLNETEAQQVTAYVLENAKQ